MIVSGQYCAYLDPQERIWKGNPGKRFNLTNLHRNADVLDSLNGICGFRSGLKTFPATLFRLPLRKCGSKLSNSCYDPQALLPLIAILRDEAKYLLLFLNSVKQVSLSCLHDGFQEEQVFEVILTSEAQRSFIDNVRAIFISESPYNVLKIVSDISSFSVVVNGATTGTSNHHWLVAQQVGSTETQVINEAARQRVLPWVGTAIELASNFSNRAGRLFCFLPMPCETTAPIPVHVNGTFALSDNRRSLKWPAEERKNDPQAKWNKLLVEYCLPSCFVDLIVKIIESKVATPNEIYKAWPDADEIKDSVEWSGFLQPFFLNLFQHKVVYSAINDGCWIRVQDAVFVPRDEDISTVVKSVLLQCKVKVTSVSQVVWSALSNHLESVETINPPLVRQTLKRAHYRFTNSENLELLEYCLKDNECCDMIGLDLLPLVNGEFGTFSRLSRSKRNRRYMCSKQVPSTLLPHSRGLLVDPPNFLHDHFKRMCTHRCTQLRSLRVEDVARLLRDFSSRKYSSQWLETFWSWVQPCDLWYFENLSIVPVGTPEHEKVAKLSKSAGVVYVPLNSCDVTPSLGAALTKYGVKPASEILCSYLKYSQELMNYLHQLNGPGVLSAIDFVGPVPLESICLAFEEASALQAFFDDNHRLIASNHNSCNTLRKLAIFHTLQCQLCSIETVVNSNLITGQAIVESDHFAAVDHELLPQAPLVISKAKNQTHLLNVLGGNVTFMNKIRFLCQVLIPMINNGSYPSTKVEALMLSILKEFKNLTESYSHEEKAIFIRLLKELHFLKNLKGQLKCPTELYDPGCSDLVSLFRCQDVFPIHPFDTCLTSLRYCGLKGLESVDAQCLVSIVEEIGRAPFKEPVQCDSISIERAIAVVKFASSITQGGDSSLINCLPNLTYRYSWLPVHGARPSNYPRWLPWKGSSYEQHLASSHTVLVALYDDIEQSVGPLIMGSEAIFINGVLPVDLANVLSSSELFLVPAVLIHLRTVVTKANLAHPQASAWVEKICTATYNFLNNACSSVTSQNEVSVLIRTRCDSPFIFTGEQFVKPSQVSRSYRFNGPYLFSLPQIIQDKTSLLDALGVKDEFEVDDLFSALKKMHDHYPGRVLSAKCCRHVDEIVSMLNDSVDTFPEIINTDDVYLPDVSYTLHRASDLSVKESWCTTGDNLFVSERLTRSAAIKIGVKTVSSRFLQNYQSSQDSFQGDPFGQQEALICRIKNILREYPFDSENATVLKELIQNADDAKATKMCVILDKRTHSQHQLLSEQWKDLQGPALLVWNDAEFTENDLKGIQRLGLGSKRDDFESIGQFGIGFNVVYHVTDCPSFITGGKTLCIFDPHCRYAPGASPSFPGRRYDNLNEDFWKTFSDLKSAYLKEPPPGLPCELQGGSLFRFPLRHTAELLDKSDIIDHKVAIRLNACDMEQMLHCWMPQVKESLLFLNHITHFSFYVVSQYQSCLEYCFEVHVNECDKSKRSVFFQMANQFRQNKKPALVTYCLSITSKTSHTSSVSKDRWLVQQGVGDVEQTIQDWSYSGSISPKHGLAALFPTGNSTIFQGKAFCFLPLPVNINLPVHVNGQFVLSSSRRSLWLSNEEGDARKIWNEKLINAISSSYVHFLVIARQHFVKHGASKEADLTKYYQLFPYWDICESRPHSRVPQIEERTILKAKRVLSSNPEGEWKVLGHHVFKKLWTNNVQILACFSRDQSGRTEFQWYNLRNEEDSYHQAYFRSHSLLKDESVKQLLIKIGMTITDAPDLLRKHFHLLNLEHSVCTSTAAFKFFTMFHRKILPSRSPTQIVDTVFQTTEQIVKFTNFITSIRIGEESGKYHQTPFGYPLLLTADEHVRVFDHNNLVISSEYTNLFPKSLCKFLHPRMLELKLSCDYFSSESKFEVIQGILKKNLPIELYEGKEIDNSNECFISWRKLQDLWKCFHSDINFMTHQDEIASHFAVIPTTECYLFSTRSSILPLVCPEETTSPQTCAAFELLKLLRLPIFDASRFSSSPDLLRAVQCHCVEMSEHGRVLETLYHFHTRTGELILPGKEMDAVSHVLFDYFRHIFFSNDKKSAKYIKSLPLFETVNGTYTSLWDKEVYAWPVECCNAGYDKWVNLESLVFLQADGEWNCLNLSIDQLSSTDLYTRFIFKSFGYLSSSERKEHLLYIRDHVLVNVSVKDKDMLLAELKTLACLKDSQNGALLPVSHFSDPNVKIFQIFSDHFKFPSKTYRDDDWLKFFKQLGLQTILKVKQFIEFCKIVASGNHHSLHNASDELLDYLFSFQTSFSFDDLDKIGLICFVRPDPLPRLSWIKTPCAPLNSTLQLTTLRGAAVSSCDKLVWTVMPVVKVPWNKYLVEEQKKLKKDLGMITQPSGEDVYNNVLSISKAALADFKLFSTYDLKDAWETGKADIVSVMSANFRALATYEHKLKDLEKVACIPVVADVTKPEHTYVLVNSLQVVWSMDASEKCFEPYINELSSGMYSVSPALEKIGVTQQIGIKHLEYILQCIHHQIGGRKIQQNQLLKVRTAILKIMKICDNDCKQQDALTELLYLSCAELTLVKSTHLLVDDSQRYGDALDFSSSSYQMFVLPPDTSSESLGRLLDWKLEVNVCLSLPERLRPKRISVHVSESNTDDVKISKTQSDLCEQLSHMIEFHKEIRLVLSQSNEGVLEPELREAIASSIAAIIEQVEVQTVSSLRADVFLTLDLPPSCLGRKPVPFLLSQTLHGSYSLSVDSMESVSRHATYKFWSELSHCLCIEAAKVGNFSPEDCLLFRSWLSELLQIKSDRDLEYFASKFSVNLGDIDTPFDVPNIGQPLQRCDCHQDINNIFRAQEWVGYEYKEDHFIYAIVLHPVLPSGKAAEYLHTFYKIKFGENEEDWKEVSALDLYKLIDDAEEDVEQRVQAASSRGLVLYTGRRSASTTSTRTKKPLSKNEKLLELKKNIYKDLTTVQNLPKESRNKALKRLYFKYHPDKAEPEEADIYDDAFKYLMKQIDNLKAGLKLDDPETESKPSHTSPQWTNYRAWNETARNMYRRRKRRSRSKRRRPRYTQPAPDNVEAKRWLRQAEADCCSLRVLKRSVLNETKTASTLCFLAHQVVEKALKACTYQLFGLDQSCLQHHQLVCLADAIHSYKCSSQTENLCKSLEHHYLKSQYPDAHQSPTAPVDVYNAVEAKECAEAAETALNIVQNLMSVYNF